MNESPSECVDERPPQAFVQRALVLDKPGAALTTVSLALTLQCKNLYNTAHFGVNNATTAYEKVEDGYRLKADLHPHQQAALDRFNAAIDRINAARRDKYAAAATACNADEKTPALNLVARLESFSASPLTSLLDITVLDNVLRVGPSGGGQI